MPRPRYNEFNERTDRFRVVLFAFCGMRQTIAQRDTYAEARDEVAVYLRSARRAGQLTATLIRGQEWELIDPDDAVMITDDAGTLAIRYPSHPRDEDEEG